MTTTTSTNAAQDSSAPVPADEQMREAVRDAVAGALTGLYHCGRVWSAWSVGTMGEDDFSPAEEDDDIIENITSAAIDAMALAAPAAIEQAGAQPVAQGRYKVVPRVPTEDHVREAAYNINRKTNKDTVTPAIVRQCYEWMLHLAAPAAIEQASAAPDWRDAALAAAWPYIKDIKHVANLYSVEQAGAQPVGPSNEQIDTLALRHDLDCSMLVGPRHTYWRAFARDLLTQFAAPTPATDHVETQLVAAVRKLIKAKGRYHTEQNYKALVDALDTYDATPVTDQPKQENQQ